MRRSLALLTVAGLLPIVALGGIFGTLTLRAQRDEVETRARTHARYTATLLRVKLADSTNAVRMIADSAAFGGDAIRGDQLRLLADGLLARQRQWRGISVADATGRPVLRVPASETVLPTDPASLAQVVATGRPAIGRVVRDAAGQLSFPVRVPVSRDGRVRYVVSAEVPAQSLRQLLLFEPLPAGWRAIMVDRAGWVAATTTSPDPGVYRPANAVALKARRTGDPAPYRFARRDGVTCVGLWARVGDTGWSVHVSAPDVYYSGPARHAVILLVGAVLLCLLLFFVLARLMFAEMRQSREREAALLHGQRMEALGRLTGGVAHDFNNLLTPIIGGLDLLRRRLPDGPRTARHLELAAGSAERARQLVARLLSFSRRQTLAPQDIALPELVSGLMELLRRSLPPSVRVDLDLPSDLPPVHADPAQLELAILNLAINARDAMPDGGVLSIFARALNEPSRDLAAGAYVGLTVADTGTGMDEATLRHAADPFFTTKTADKGTGLGLSMAHGFAGQSGGTLRLASTPGEGTAVTIVLPQGSAPRPEPARPVAVRDSRPRRVLLVDDDDAARASTVALLRAGGHQVTEATGVDEALARLAEDRSLDAIVTDYLMPRRSGADLIRTVRAGGSTVPLLLITGYMGESADVPKDVPKLTKPFNSEELERALDRAVAATETTPPV